MKQKPGRSFIVAPRQTGRSLLDTLQAALHLSRKDALAAVQTRKVRLEGRCCTEPRRQVKAGQRIDVQLRTPPATVTKRPGRPVGTDSKRSQRPGATVSKRSNRPTGIKIRHVDAQVLVVEKPAGLTTVRHEDEQAAYGKRARKYLPPTLVELLPDALRAHGISAPGYLRAVHRIDKETTGLVVLARTPEAERHLGKQFRLHTVGRTYLALVRGHPREQTISTRLVPDRGDGRRGSSPDNGQPAVTHVRLRQTLGTFALVECRLETGRTHQVRIHLGEVGTPLCGERIYDRPLHGKPLPDGSEAKRPMLHAATLAFDHPADDRRLEFTAPLPADMEALKQRLLQSGQE